MFSAIQGDSFQFRKQFLYLRIDREPEIAVASKHIFKEAGLALVNTHERAVVGLCVLQRGIDILLKDAMTTLVDGREHGTEWIIRPEMEMCIRDSCSIADRRAAVLR